MIHCVAVCIPTSTTAMLLSLILLLIFGDTCGESKYVNISSDGTLLRALLRTNLILLLLLLVLPLLLLVLDFVVVDNNDADVDVVVVPFFGDGDEN